jgi:Fic family protein
MLRKEIIQKRQVTVEFFERGLLTAQAMSATCTIKARQVRPLLKHFSQSDHSPWFFASPANKVSVPWPVVSCPLERDPSARHWLDLWRPGRQRVSGSAPRCPRGVSRQPSNLRRPHSCTATLNVLTEETIKSSAIEGVVLNQESVLSSIAKNLGLAVAGLKEHKDRNVDEVVEMMLDATQKFNEPLTKERLSAWHVHLFPGVRTTADKSRVGAWRDDSRGPLQVISGPIARPKVHYVAPAATRLDREMENFLEWFESDKREDPLLKTAIAHLWFVTVHPFEDGNGRIARAIAEMCLARSDGGAQRFYNMSSQILEERKSYYEVLEKTQSGTLEITEWLAWFLKCLDRAIEQSNRITSRALEKESFWMNLKDKNAPLNSRQKKVLNKLFNDFEGRLTREKWMKLTRASSRTALRDIAELIDLGVLEREAAGGRSTSYRLKKAVNLQSSPDRKN